MKSDTDNNNNQSTYCIPILLNKSPAQVVYYLGFLNELFELDTL